LTRSEGSNTSVEPGVAFVFFKNELGAFIWVAERLSVANASVELRIPLEGVERIEDCGKGKA